MGILHGAAEGDLTAEEPSSKDPQEMNKQTLYFGLLVHGPAGRISLADAWKWQPTYSILTWKIPWAEEPEGLQSKGSQELDTTQRLNHHKFLEQRSLESYRPWGRKELVMTDPPFSFLTGYSSLKAVRPHPGRPFFHTQPRSTPGLLPQPPAAQPVNGRTDWIAKYASRR